MKAATLARRIENELRKEEADDETRKLIAEFWSIEEDLADIQWYLDRIEILENRTRSTINTVLGYRFCTGQPDRDGYCGHVTSAKHGYLIGVVRREPDSHSLVSLITADHLRTYTANSMYELAKQLKHVGE